MLGCPDFECEVDAFGAREIFMFPYYILHNQRAAWSEYYDGFVFAIIVATGTMLLLLFIPRACCQMSVFCCVLCGDECGKTKGCADLCGPYKNTNPGEAPSSERVCEMIGWPYKTMFTRVVDHYWRREAPTNGLLSGTYTKGYVYVRQFSLRLSTLSLCGRCWSVSSTAFSTLRTPCDASTRRTSTNRTV